MKITEIQAALQEARVDGWLFYAHHYRDPIGYRILGLGDNLHVTRRWFYWEPAVGGAEKVAQRLGAGRVGMRASQSRIAVQRSPRNAIMCVSLVDAGTVELLRGMGKEIVSSADL